eukprot:gb/GECH01013672.1/.p1 GENE.gb/GECH01013672.1/~~gb/GECH01013672.1/.p1  ORF type:complete len:333 (+),score=61.79 gb/GECH01013672.1/:1-999(+)
MPPTKDFKLPDPPQDSISSLTWCGPQYILAAGSWDGEVRVWDVQGPNQAQAKTSYKHQAPVLDISCSQDGRLFSGGCDNTVQMIDLANPSPSVVAKHDAPIKCVEYVEGANVLATAGWDKKLRYWDTRQSNPVAEVDIPDKAVSASHFGNLFVLAYGPKHVAAFDMQQPTTPQVTFESKLSYQTRCLAVFTQGPPGFVMASIEGRASVRYIDEKTHTNAFTFKCHRKDAQRGQPAKLFPVNDIAVHRQYGTFATVGADGVYCFWDKDAKQRLRQFNTEGQLPVVSCDFTQDGKLFAYAKGYDWSQGPDNYVKDTAIYCHIMSEEEIKARGKK